MLKTRKGKNVSRHKRLNERKKIFMRRTNLTLGIASKPVISRRFAANESRNFVRYCFPRQIEFWLE